MPQKIQVINTTLNVFDTFELLDLIDSARIDNQAKIATVNPEFILEAIKNVKFKEALENYSSCIDGSGLYMMLKLYSYRIDKLAGADLIEMLFRKYQKGQKSFYFIGGKDGVTEKAQSEITKKYPQIKIVGISSGGKVGLDGKINQKEIDLINESQPDILLIGFGAPRQELFIQKHSSELKVKSMIGIGGSFDFYSNKKRAPLWMQKLKIEWLHRSMFEPGHWRRALRAVVVFPIRYVLWKTFSFHKN